MSVGATTLLMGERPTPDATFRRWTGGVAASSRPCSSARPPASPACCVAEPAEEERGRAAPRLLGRRSAARRDRRALQGAFRRRHRRRHRLHRDAAHLHQQPPGPWWLRQHRLAGAGLPHRAARRRRASPVPDGEPGDLYIHGPSAAMMYWGNRQKTRDTFQGGWTKSGDKYIRNADGSYTYGGRSDDMLKVSGIYVSPFEVEATLVQHPAVLEAAVIGVPDAEGLTKTKAFVVLKAGAEATDAELKAFVKDKLAPTSTRARSSSWPTCPRRPPARSSASSCANSKGRPSELLVRRDRLGGGKRVRIEHAFIAPVRPLRANGDSGAPLLVFLHEGLGSLAMWAISRRRCAMPPACAAWSGRARLRPLDAARRRGLGSGLHAPPGARGAAGAAGASASRGTDPLAVRPSDGGSIALLHAAKFSEAPPAPSCWRRTSWSRTCRWRASPRPRPPTKPPT